MAVNHNRRFYLLPFLALIAIAAINYYLYCGLGQTGDWRGIYSIEGLFLDAIGAIIVLAGDLAVLRDRFIPTDQISRISKGRSILFTQGENFTKSDTGFNKIWSIITERIEIDESVASRVVRLQVASASPRAITSRTAVWYWVEDEEWDREQYIEDLDEDQDPVQHPSEGFERIKIGSESLVDGWIDQEIKQLERNAKQLPLQIGILFFLTGFLLQGLGQVLTLLPVAELPLC